MNITITGCRVEMTDEEWEDLVDAAGYGIGYWASEAEVDSVNHQYHVTEEAPSGDAGERGIKRILTKDHLERAIARLVSGDVEVDGGGRIAQDHTYVGYILHDDIDSDAADFIIQTAMFGKIVYG